MHAHRLNSLLQASPDSRSPFETGMLTDLNHCCRLVRSPGDVSLAQQKVTQYGDDEQWEVQAIVAEATDLSGNAIFLVMWKVGRSPITLTFFRRGT